MVFDRDRWIARAERRQQQQESRAGDAEHGRQAEKEPTEEKNRCASARTKEAEGYVRGVEWDILKAMKGGEENMSILSVPAKDLYEGLYFNLYQLLAAGVISVSQWEQEFEECKRSGAGSGFRNKAEFLRKKVYGFVKRLFVANQLAVWSGHKVGKPGVDQWRLEVLSEGFKKRKRLSQQALYVLLNSVDENCMDHLGQQRIGATDYKLLKAIRTQIACGDSGKRPGTGGKGAVKGSRPVAAGDGVKKDGRAKD